jgi:hypothetical protein
MLQLSENKGRRSAQIAKKFKNGLLHFPRFFRSRTKHKTLRDLAPERTTNAGNWNFPPLGATVDSARSTCEPKVFSKRAGKR